MSVGEQLWISRRNAASSPRPEAFRPVPPSPELFALRKPRDGGFWTSTLDALGSSWMRWCMSEGYADPSEEPGYRFYALTPRADARVFEIDGCYDLQRLIEEHPARFLERGPFCEPGVDWHSALQAYDGINLTETGMVATRWGCGGVQDTYGWDCESTVWGRWAFESVREIDGAPLIAAALRELDRV